MQFTNPLSKVAFNPQPEPPRLLVQLPELGQAKQHAPAALTKAAEVGFNPQPDPPVARQLFPLTDGAFLGVHESLTAW